MSQRCEHQRVPPCSGEMLGARARPREGRRPQGRQLFPPRANLASQTVLKWRIRRSIALKQGGWVVRDAISGQAVTPPATSEEAQEAVAQWNARCVTRQVEPPVKVDGWGPAGELRAWLLAHDGWWGLVAGRNGVQWMRANDLRPSRRWRLRSVRGPTYAGPSP